MRDEDEYENPPADVRNSHSGTSEIAVQAGVVRGDVNISAGLDAKSDLENPVIASVALQPGATLADLVVDDDPPRHMTPSGTIHVITLEARTMRAVILEAARAVVVSRRPPRPACLEVRVGGVIEPRRFLTDLDADPPELLAEGADFPFTISATDVEQFWFEPVVTTDEVAWQLELDWRCAGRTGTTLINDNGKPFEAYPVRALFSRDSDDGYSVLHSGCGFGGHHPGCPTRRLPESSSSTPTQVRPIQAASTLATTTSGSTGTVDAVGTEVDAAGPARTADANSAEDIYRIALDLSTALSDADPDDAGSWPAYRKFATHVQTLVSRPELLSRSRESEPLRTQLVSVLRYLFVSRQYQRGIAIARTLQRDWTTALGEDHPDTLAVANRLAGYFFGTGQYAQARDVWQDILPRCERTLGDEHAQTLTIAGNLGAVHRDLHEYEAARSLLEENLRRTRHALDATHPQTLRTTDNLVGVLCELNDHEAARALSADALRRCQATLGASHPHTVRTTKALAHTLRDLGDPDAAAALERGAPLE